MQVQTISCERGESIYTVPSNLLFKSWADSQNPEPLSKILLIKNATDELVLAVLCPPATDRFQMKPAKRQNGVERARIDGLGDKQQGKVYLCHLSPHGTASFKVTMLPGESAKPTQNFQDALSVHATGVHLVVPILAIAKGGEAPVESFSPSEIQHPSLKAIRLFLQSQRLSEKEILSRKLEEEERKARKERLAAAAAAAAAENTASSSSSSSALKLNEQKKAQKGIKSGAKGGGAGLRIPELANLAKWSIMTKEEKKLKLRSGDGEFDERIIDDILKEEYEECDQGEVDHLETSSLNSARYKRQQLLREEKENMERVDVESINPASIMAGSKTEADISKKEELEFYQSIINSARKSNSARRPQPARKASLTKRAAKEKEAPIQVTTEASSGEVAFVLDGKKYDAFGRVL